MPDLVAHLASACAAAVPFRDRRSFRILFYLGVLLPDIATRGVYILAERLVTHAHALTVPMHTPIGYAVLCLLLAQLWRVRAERRRALLALLAGGALHFAFDVFQGHIGVSYFWAFPFSWMSYEAGLFGTEASVGWLPVTLGVVLLVEGWGALRDRRRREQLAGGR